MSQAIYDEELESVNSQDALLNETLQPLSGAADLSDDGPGDSPDDDGGW